MSNTIPIFALDGHKIGDCQDWHGVQHSAAWYFGCAYDAINSVDSVETFDTEGDCIEWLLVDGKIVGTLHRPAPMPSTSVLTEAVRLDLQNAAQSIRAASKALDNAASANPMIAHALDLIKGVQFVEVPLAEKIEELINV